MPLRVPRLTLVLLLLAPAAGADPLHRPMTDEERTTFGGPMAKIAREVMSSVPEQYQPCELERDAADLVRPDTLVEGEAITTDEVIRPDRWVVPIRCKTGSVVIRFDRLRVAFEDIRMENLTLVARSSDYLHVRQKGSQRGEILYVRSDEDPTASGLATARTIEVRWVGMNPRDSVKIATKVARQLLSKTLFRELGITP